MNLEKKLYVVAAASWRGMSFKASGLVWLLVGALGISGVGTLQAAALIFHGVNYLNNNWDTNASDQNWQSGGSLFLNFNNGDSVTFNNVGAPSTNVNVVGFVQPAAIIVDTSAVNYAFTNATGSIIGTGGLLVTGTGKLTLATTNAYTGGTTVSNALLQLNSTIAAGTGPITNSSGTVYVNFGGLANSLTCFGTATFTNSGHTGGIGTLNGSGTLAINSPGQVFDFTGNMTGYGGTLILSNCTSGVRFNGTAGSSSATFDLGAGTESILIRNNGTSFALGALAGGASTTLSGNGSYALAIVYSIGGNNANTTFSGKIVDGGFTGNPSTSITKVGSGTLTLAGTNTFTGTTTVSVGTLTLTNSATLTNSSSITVNAGATLNLAGAAPFNELDIYTNKTLKGGGVVAASSVVVAAGGTVLPGDGVGVLTVSNGTFSSAGLITMELNRTNATATNDMLKASTITITGGTLTVTNLGPDLHTGDSFKLFSVAIGGSGFTTVSLPASNVLNSVQYVWTNRLALDGSIQLLSGASASPSPTNISYTVAGNQLILNWPNGQGWRLLAQTNSLLTGLTTNWFSTGVTTSPFTNMVNPANGTVFYRLTYP